MNSQTFKAHLLVLLATLLVAGSFIASEKLAGLINPFSLMLLRFVVATLILAPVVLARRAWRQAIPSVFPRSLVISFFYAAFFIGMFEALTTTDSLNTGSIFTLMPLLTALIGTVLLRERLRLRQVLAYLVGAVGTIWVIFRGDVEALLNLSLNPGDKLFLLATLCMCFYSISMKKLYRNDPMPTMVFCTLLGGCCWTGLAMLVLAQPLDWQLIQGSSIAHMAYLVIGATLVTVYLYQRTTVVLGPSRVNAYIYLNPFLVAVLLLVVDQQPIPVIVIPGVLLSAAAMLVLQMLANRYEGF